MQFGFSYIGLLYLCMLFVPNILWARKLPIGYDASHENRCLRLLERIGQIGASAVVLLFRDFNVLLPLNVWSMWFFLSLTFMLFYEICWIRYFCSAKTNHDFYKSFFSIPAPLATLPVAAFFCLALYGKNVLLLFFTILLGIGHIGIHVEHIKREKE
ncbi:MAG: hypothetical protein ACOX3W_06835 [Christensenellaceae bacterium]|jgi:hypothetical protein